MNEPDASATHKEPSLDRASPTRHVPPKKSSRTASCSKHNVSLPVATPAGWRDPTVTLNPVTESMTDG